MCEIDQRKQFAQFASRNSLLAALSKTQITYVRLHIGFAQYGMVFPHEYPYEYNKNSTECIVTRWALRLMEWHRGIDIVCAVDLTLKII